MRDLFIIRSQIEIERRRRIMLSIWAYAYEFENKSLVSDAVFDSEARLVDSNIKTGHLVMDDFFATKFHPDTGMWIHSYPELDKLRRLYDARFQSRTV